MVLSSLPVLLGRFGLWAVAAGSLWALIATVVSMRKGGGWARSARRGMVVALVGAILAAAGLEWALFHHDFSLPYVASVSAKNLPSLYLFSAWWGSLEGSLLLWCLLVLAFAVPAQQTKGMGEKVRRAFPLLPAATALFFAGVMLRFANPLSGWPGGGAGPSDGIGLNPLLQDPGMAYHPPLLYLGFTGLVVPGAWALAILFTGEKEDWTKPTRRWVLAAWGMLSAGILLGSWWAYHELGWGGWWFWDPVENASLMPWLALTAYAHGALAQEARGMLRRWNLGLLLLAYALTLFGTFLTRSGILTSVHAFSESGLGSWFLGYIAVFLLIAFGVLAWRWDDLDDPKPPGGLITKEGAILYNHLLFGGLLLAVLLGTTWPILAELATGERVSVGAPFFDATIPPIALPTLFLMAVAPWFGWGRTGKESLRPRLIAGVVGGVVVSGGLAWARASMGMGMGGWAHVVSVFILGAVLGPILADFVRTARAVGGSRKALIKRPRHWGGLLVHLGIAVLAVGATGASGGKTAVDFQLAPQETAVVVEGVSLRHVGVTVKSRKSHRAWIANVVLTQQGKEHPLQSERRDYGSNWPGTTEMALLSNWKRDIAITLAETESDGSASYRVTIQPFLSWLWVGGALSLLGFLWAGRKGG